MIEPTISTTLPSKIQLRRPILMPKEAIIIHPSHDANKNVDVTMDILYSFFGFYSSNQCSNFQWRVLRLLTPMAFWNSGVRRIPPKTPASQPKVMNPRLPEIMAQR